MDVGIGGSATDASCFRMGLFPHGGRPAATASLDALFLRLVVEAGQILPHRISGKIAALGLVQMFGTQGS